MKIIITTQGNFEYLEAKESIIKVNIDLIKMLDDGTTIQGNIEESFEDFNGAGCRCSFNESNNHCDCDGHGYNYNYKIISIKEDKGG